VLELASLAWITDGGIVLGRFLTSGEVIGHFRGDHQLDSLADSVESSVTNAIGLISDDEVISKDDFTRPSKFLAYLHINNNTISSGR